MTEVRAAVVMVQPRRCLELLRVLISSLLLLGHEAAVAEEQPDTPGIDRLLSAVVGIRAQVPADARTAAALGTERTGSGVVIDASGLIVTIGYLILEASRVQVLVGDDLRDLDADELDED